jgi:hypothetical protein
VSQEHSHRDPAIRATLYIQTKVRLNCYVPNRIIEIGCKLLQQEYTDLFNQSGISAHVSCLDIERQVEQRQTRSCHTRIRVNYLV